jgi:acyl dehydratase
LIDEPLAPNWRYDLGSRKIFELRSSLGLSGDGPAPPSSVFAYAVVPGLARMLTHPAVAALRSELRMSRLEVVFASELDLRGELRCSIDVDVSSAVVGTIASSDQRGGRAVATLHLTTDDDHVNLAPLEGPSATVHTSANPARAIAFSAATWDLNPAYWDEDFATRVGMGGVVVPPGLSLALSLEAIRAAEGKEVDSYDVIFERAARPGDELEIRFRRDHGGVDFESVSEDGVVVAGRVGLRASEVGL